MVILLFSRDQITNHTMVALHGQRNSKLKCLAGNDMTIIFRSTKDISITDYLQNGQTVNSEYYSNFLFQLKEPLKEKCQGKLQKGVLFL